jgi:elongation factor 1-beta
MATAILQIKVMPSSPDTDLLSLKQKIEEKLTKAGAKRIEKIEEQDIAFGLKALIVTLAWPEEKETEEAEKALSGIEDVSSVDIIDYRRAFG